MIDLIKRLEAAAEGSRELDALIVVALDLRPDWAPIGEMWIDRDTGIGEPVVRINSIGRKSAGNVPIGDYAHYTTSLDAALTLVACPEDHGPLWTWSIEARLSGEGRHTYEAQITVPSREWMGWSRTPALALCIAALRARNEGEGRA